MSHHLVCRASVAGAIIIAAGLAALQPSNAASPQLKSNATAQFEHRTIDLSIDWGDAKACAITPTGNRCYRTEEQMTLAESELSPGPSPMSTCATPLKLYANTSYGGTVLSVSTRFAYVNLGAMDNATSSYQVGGCSSSFYDGTSGGGAVYPGSTSAGASAASMASGWDNRVSSVYLN